MPNLTESNECAAIVENFTSALAEMPSEPADRFGSDRDVSIKMVGGAKEDAERIAEKNQFCPEFSGPLEMPEGLCRKVHDASRKVIVRFRSGHTGLLNQFFNK